MGRGGCRVASLACGVRRREAVGEVEEQQVTRAPSREAEAAQREVGEVVTHHIVTQHL